MQDLWESREPSGVGAGELLCTFKLPLSHVLWWKTFLWNLSLCSGITEQRQPLVI